MNKPNSSLEKYAKDMSRRGNANISKGCEKILNPTSHQENAK